MDTTRNAAAGSSPTLCECGDDHRNAETRNCPLFEIRNRLNKRIEEFLDVQQILEFGKNGPMANCLQRVILSKLTQAWTTFSECQSIVEKHPEWCLTKEICRLRIYFSGVAKGCAEDKRTATFRSSLLALTECVDGEDYSLKNAKKWAFLCWMDCDGVIEEYVRSGAVPVSYARDPKGYLATVDKTFKRAVGAIILVPNIENTMVQELMSASYETWAESRRLLCDFKPSHRETAF